MAGNEGSKAPDPALYWQQLGGAPTQAPVDPLLDSELAKLCTLIKGSADPAGAVQAALAAVEALSPPEVIAVMEEEEAVQGSAQGSVAQPEPGSPQRPQADEEEGPEKGAKGAQAASPAAEGQPESVCCAESAEPAEEEGRQAADAPAEAGDAGQQAEVVQETSQPQHEDADTDRRGAAAPAAAAAAAEADNKADKAEHSTPAAEPPPVEREKFPELQDALKAFKKCSALLNVFKSNPSMANKTPLAILHEYVNRISVELAYSEESESPLGPFIVEAKVTSTGGHETYALASGRGRSKKDAKQLAAAAALEQMLASVPQSEFLVPGKSKLDKALKRREKTGQQGGVPPHQQRPYSNNKPGRQQGLQSKRPLMQDGPARHPPHPAKRQQFNRSFSPQQNQGRGDVRGRPGGGNWGRSNDERRGQWGGGGGGNSGFYGGGYYGGNNDGFGNSGGRGYDDGYYSGDGGYRGGGDEQGYEPAYFRGEPAGMYQGGGGNMGPSMAGPNAYRQQGGMGPGMDGAPDFMGPAGGNGGMGPGMRQGNMMGNMGNGGGMGGMAMDGMGNMGMNGGGGGFNNGRNMGNQQMMPGMELSGPPMAGIGSDMRQLHNPGMNSGGGGGWGHGGGGGW